MAICYMVFLSCGLCAGIISAISVAIFPTNIRYMIMYHWTKMLFKVATIHHELKFFIRKYIYLHQGNGNVFDLYVWPTWSGFRE